MNWTPGKIMGTVKPAGAVAVAEIPAPILVVAPPTALPVAHIVKQQLSESAAVPQSSSVTSTATVTVSSGQPPPTVGILQGTVQSLAAGGDKIHGTVKLAGSDQPGMSSEHLTKQAIEEIYRDIKINRIRASQAGSVGWQSCPLKRTNKRFLNRTVKSVIQHNNRQTIRSFHSSTRKLIELDHRDDVRHRHRERRHADREDERRKGNVENTRKSAVVVIKDDDELEEGEVRSDDEH